MFWSLTNVEPYAQNSNGSTWGIELSKNEGLGTFMARSMENTNDFHLISGTADRWCFGTS